MSKKFQKIVLAPPERGGLGWTVSFEEFLVFMSRMFRTRRDTVEAVHVLICEEHGEFSRILDIVRPGEVELMEAIGKHLDEVPHTWK